MIVKRYRKKLRKGRNSSIRNFKVTKNIKILKKFQPAFLRQNLDFPRLSIKLTELALPKTGLIFRFN